MCGHKDPVVSSLLVSKDQVRVEDVCMRVSDMRMCIQCACVYVGYVMYARNSVRGCVCEFYMCVYVCVCVHSAS